MSLHHLFARPNVEVARGHIEPGLAPKAQEIARPEPNRRISSADRLPFSRLRNLHIAKPKHQPPSDKDGLTWQPPSLAQVHTQALRLGSASTISTEPTGSFKAFSTRAVSWARPSRRSRHDDERATTQQHVSRKCFALLSDGVLLQYSDKGNYTCLPEMVLTLSSESAVVPMGPIHGYPYALQIFQASADNDNSDITSSPKALARLGLRAPPQQDGLRPNMVMLFKDSEKQAAWLLAIRDVISTIEPRASVADGASKRYDLSGGHTKDDRRPWKTMRRLSAHVQGKMDPTNTEPEPTSYLVAPTRPTSEANLLLSSRKIPPSRIPPARPESHVVDCISPGTSPDSTSDSLLSATADTSTPATSISSLFSEASPVDEVERSFLLPGKQNVSASMIGLKPQAFPQLRSKFAADGQAPSYRQLHSVTDSRTSKPAIASAKKLPDRNRASSPRNDDQICATNLPSQTQQRELSLEPVAERPRVQRKPIRMPLKITPQSAYKGIEAVRPRQGAVPRASSESSIPQVADHSTITTRPGHGRSLSKLSLFPVAPLPITLPARHDSMPAVSPKPISVRDSSALTQEVGSAPETRADDLQSRRPNRPVRELSQSSTPSIVHQKFSPHLSKKVQPISQPAPLLVALPSVQPTGSVRNSKNDAPSALPQIPNARSTDVPKFATRSFLKRPPTLQIRTHSEPSLIRTPKSATRSGVAKAEAALDLLRKRSMTALRTVANGLNETKVEEITSTKFEAEKEKQVSGGEREPRNTTSPIMAKSSSKASTTTGKREEWPRHDGPKGSVTSSRDSPSPMSPPPSRGSTRPSTKDSSTSSKFCRSDLPSDARGQGRTVHGVFPGQSSNARTHAKRDKCLPPIPGSTAGTETDLTLSETQLNAGPPMLESSATLASPESPVLPPLRSNPRIDPNAETKGQADSEAVAQIQLQIRASMMLAQAQAHASSRPQSIVQLRPQSQIQRLQEQPRPKSQIQVKTRASVECRPRPQSQYPALSAQSRFQTYSRKHSSRQIETQQTLAESDLPAHDHPEFQVGHKVVSPLSPLSSKLTEAQRRASIGPPVPPPAKQLPLIPMPREPPGPLSVPVDRKSEEAESSEGAHTISA